MEILRDRDDEVRDREGIVRTPSRDRAGSCGDRTHLQRLVCGIVRGSYAVVRDREGVVSASLRDRMGS